MKFEANPAGRFAGMDRSQVSAALESEGMTQVQINEYFQIAENIRREDAGNVSLREAILEGERIGRERVHRRWADWAERRWNEVFSDEGIPFIPEIIEKIEIPPLETSRHPLPGWNELISLQGSTKIPYVDAYGTRKNFTQEVREGRRARVKEIKKLAAKLEKNPTSTELKYELRELKKLQASYEPTVQAMQIIGMLDRLKLFVELWEVRCREILEWEAADVKKHVDLPEFFKDDIRQRQIQDNKWRELQEPKTEAPPKPGLMERVPGGEFEQKLRNRPILGEDGHIYGSEEELEQAKEREGKDELEWLEDA